MNADDWPQRAQRAQRAQRRETKTSALLCVLCVSVAINSYPRSSAFICGSSLLSFKFAMHIPASGFADAEDPEALARLVFDVEVIARLVSSLPPLAGDALGACGVGQAVHLPSPGEGDGLAVAVFGRR